MEVHVAYANKPVQIRITIWVTLNRRSETLENVKKHNLDIKIMNPSWTGNLQRQDRQQHDKYNLYIHEINIVCRIKLQT
jgi:predicted aldo/keto reductase-like oxidoreductase